MSLCLYAMVAFDRDSGIAAESAIKYFVLGSMASGTLLYGMSILYGVTGIWNSPRSPRRCAAGFAGQYRPHLRHRVPHRRHRVQAGRRAVPHVDTGRVRRLAHLRDGVHRHRIEARRFRARHAPVAGGARRLAGRLEPDAGGALGAVDRHRQRGRDRADQHQAHARVLDDLAHRIYSCSASWPAPRRVIRPRCST